MSAKSQNKNLFSHPFDLHLALMFFWDIVHKNKKNNSNNVTSFRNLSLLHQAPSYYLNNFFPPQNMTNDENFYGGQTPK